MPVGLLGRKVGMTQVYVESGELEVVTVIEAGPCPVLQLRTEDRDGYEAVQIGFGKKPRRLAARSERGRVANINGRIQKQKLEAGEELLPKADCEPPVYVREFRTEGEDHSCEVGQDLTVAVFADQSHVDVIGTSKGRGFAGVMKRHNFQGQRATHGVKRVHRHGGSIGMSADPARVLKGTRMGGRYGGTQITVRHLKVVKIDEENNILLVRGAIPGPNGGMVIIRHTNKY
jgi:large subunit ribosomal protein L3